MICRPCLALPCDAPDVLASGIDTALYSSLDFSFIEDCPTGCICQPGLFPRTISILASTIPPVIPPILEPGEQIILRLQGCSSLITRTLVAGSTQAQIAAAAQSMQAEWAGQQALCIAQTLPGVNCNPANVQFIKVCNDAQTGWCGDVISAGTVCQTLQTAGLTQAQIDSAIAAMKPNLNQLALYRACNGWLCPITETMAPVGGSNEIHIFVNNISSTESFDSTGILLCLTGKTDCNVFHFNPSVPPMSNLEVTGGLSALYAVSGFEVYYNGTLIFVDLNTAPTGRRDVTLQVGC